MLPIAVPISWDEVINVAPFNLGSTRQEDNPSHQVFIGIFLHWTTYSYPKYYNSIFENFHSLIDFMSGLAKKNVELGSRVARAQGTSVKSLEFYREVARCLPTIMKQYKLGELTTLAEMRRNVSDLMRKNSAVRDPSAVDILIYKGREELEMILMNHKQRHHLISQFVRNPAKERVEKISGMSPFLEAFYQGR